MIRDGLLHNGRHGFISILLLGQLLGAVLTASDTRAAGEVPGSPSPQSQRDPVAEQLFPPELVMSHQAEIGLTAAQRGAIVEELQKLQTQVVPLQFEVQAAAEALVKLLASERVDEVNALAQARRVMDLEIQVRVKHLALLVRIKNLLSAEQRATLAVIRGGDPR